MKQREIKFRAFTQEGQMIDVGFVELFTDGSYRVNDEIPIASGNLMQYTGLKDKDGREIYEGDVVHHAIEEGRKEYGPDNSWAAGTAQVIACAMGWMFSEIDCGDWRFNGPEGDMWDEKYMTIIGNIYENPELLTK